MLAGCAEEKVRRTCWQGWRELAAAEVNLKRIIDDDVNGATSRCADILTFWQATEKILLQIDRCVFVRVS
jgi:hypothetical protein